MAKKYLKLTVKLVIEADDEESVVSELCNAIDLIQEAYFCRGGSVTSSPISALRVVNNADADADADNGEDEDEDEDEE